MRERTKKIVVIGSGFGGLGAAVRLARRGYEVELIEARDQLGGRAYVYRQDGFTFDGGPTVITAPFLIEELFTEAGRRMGDYVRLVPVDPFYRIVFADGRHFDYAGDIEETARRVREFSPGDEAGYRRMIATAGAIFQKGFVELSDRPFLKFTDMLRVAPDLVRLQSYRTVYGFVSQYIRDERLRRVFSFHPLLVGGNPFTTTSIYALIHHLEREWGVHYAMGGTGKIVEALGRLFTELGGRTRLNARVKQIRVENGAVAGVELNTGEILRCDAVVSNADVATTYMRMIAPEHRPHNTDNRFERMRYSMSLFVIYFGTRGRTYPDVKHHTILLGERYQGLLEDIFEKKTLPEDFSIYLHRPTATDASMAPPDGECFYVLAPVPNQASGIDWEIEGPRLRDRIFEYLEQTCLPGLHKHLAAERWLTPVDFETTLASYQGAAFSFEPVLTQSAWFRPHNESEDVGNLFFVGAGTHPGAGVPGVLCSAKIAEKLICERMPI